jgi:hypothetical protein
MATEISEAEALAAALGKLSDSVTIKDVEIQISPLCIDQIADIMLSIDRLAAKGLRVEALVTDEAHKPETSLSYTQLVLRGGKDFRDILATACKQTPEFVGSLNILELAKLTGKVWKVNKDFFGQNQTEILQAFGLDETHVAQITNLAGSIKSLVTSAPTESQTSAGLPSEKSSQSAVASTENSDLP